MWKFQDFSISNVLREINFGGSRSAKPTITHLEALNFSFCDFLHFLKAKIYQTRFKALKTVIFKNSRSSKIDFT